MLSINELKVENVSYETQKAMKDMPKEIKDAFAYLMQLANR